MSFSGSSRNKIKPGRSLIRQSPSTGHSADMKRINGINLMMPLICINRKLEKRNKKTIGDNRSMSCGNSRTKYFYSTSSLLKEQVAARLGEKVR